MKESLLTEKEMVFLLLLYFHDVINNKKLNSIVSELFIRGRNLNISLFLLHNHTLRFQKMLD